MRARLSMTTLEKKRSLSNKLKMQLNRLIKKLRFNSFKIKISRKNFKKVKYLKKKR